MSDTRMLSTTDLAEVIHSTPLTEQLGDAIIEQTSKIIEEQETGIKEEEEKKVEISEEQRKEIYDKGFNDGYTKANYDMIGKCVDNVSSIQKSEVNNI